MTCFDSNTPLVRSFCTVARALMVTFLAVPGAGFALLAVACGDMDTTAQPARDAMGSVDVQAVVAQPVVPSLPAPAPIDVTPVVDERPSLILPGETVEATEVAEATEDLERSHPCDGLGEEPPSALRIIEAGMANGVQNRQPIRDTDGFDIGEKAWAWVSVANTGDKAPITMTWRRDGKVRSRMTLEVGKSPRWRTWSRLKMRSYDAGAWTVEVLDENGHLLDTLNFVVHPEAVDLTGEPDFTGC